jgi:hypothetical protein
MSGLYRYLHNAFVFTTAILSLCTATSGAASTKLPEWVQHDCQKDTQYYYFVGFGKGADAAESIRNALLSSRKNALACVFGGAINTNISVKESAQQIEYSSVTVVDLTYEHVNWSGYEQAPDKVLFLNTSDHQLYSQYRWSLNDIQKEQDRLKSLAKKIEENRSLKKEVDATKKISDQKETLIKSQQQELSRYKKHEIDLANLKSKKEKVLAELAQMKAQRNDKGKEFVSMVTRMGCDVTLDDLTKLIGPPSEINVAGICYNNCEFSVLAAYIPVLQYRYGDFSINAYVDRVNINKDSDWNRIKKYRHETQIVLLEKVRGQGGSWLICDEGYQFVRDRLKRS